MRILHITDSHGTAKGPESRKDIYYISFLKKLYELGFVVKQQKIDCIIHTGDLFHTARVSDKFAGQVSEMIKNIGVPFYVVPGNHDIEGYTTATIDQTKLGLLAKAGVVSILDRDNPIVITGAQNVKGTKETFTVAISGQEYYAHIDEGNMADFEMQQDEADVNILAIHGYIADTPQNPNIKCTMVNDIVSDADIILTGHYHRQFSWKNSDLEIYNPGSMMRVEQTEYNKTHTPQYGILDISLDDEGYIMWDYNFHPFKIAQPSTIIFDYTSKYKAKATSITLEGFKNSIANTMTSINITNNVRQIIDDIALATNDSALSKASLDAYDNAFQNAPDEFEVKQGFIPSQHRKYIKKVILDRFQSHYHTEVEMDDGLNIIVGESNNGKTSILRGIMWAVTNQPLGTDFIMAGQDGCYVKVIYNDGTYIERGRTLKDTGYYDVCYIDDMGKLQTQTYRGFTNAVPVEVDNIHQMPKVSITKDIETHLNVLSQLDGPFLLTQSPQVKASAIGRITGTHIIDSAIKETNKSIQSNKKIVKVHEETIHEEEEKLKALPNVQLIGLVSKKYNNIITYLENSNNDNNKVENYLSQIRSIDVSIAQQTAQYNKDKAVSSIGNIVSDSLSKYTWIKRVSQLEDSINNVSDNITNNESIIKSTEGLVSISPLVSKLYDRISDSYSFIRTLNDKYEFYLSVDKKIEENEKSYNAVKSYNEKISDIISFCNIDLQYITRLMPMVNQLSELESSQSNSAKDIASVKKIITANKKEITKVQKEKNNFIMQNGLCPCCGEPITKDSASKIEQFMEGLSCQ